MYGIQLNIFPEIDNSSHYIISVLKNDTSPPNNFIINDKVKENDKENENTG